MGAYINPPDCSKETWLAEHGVHIEMPESLQPFLDANLLVVCLVINPAFTAAGICFDQRELEAFSDPADRRPKFWFACRQDELLAVSDLAVFLK